MQETQLKCTKARNDYLLNLAAANAAMNKYYLQDVSTLIDVRNTQFVLFKCVFVGLRHSVVVGYPLCATISCYFQRNMKC